MIKIPDDKYGNRAWVVKARKPFWCDGRWTGCTGQIQSGEHYYRCVAFPDGDVNTGDTPWVLRMCRGCLHEDARAGFDVAVAADAAGVSP